MTSLVLMRARKFAACFIAAVSISPITACAGPNPSPTAESHNCVASGDTIGSVVLVVPVHRGAAAPTIPSSWACTLQDALEHHIPVSVVTSEGEPQVPLRNFTAEISDINPNAHHDDLVAAENRVIDAATSAQATSDGNDLWAALNVSAGLGAGFAGLVRILSADSALSDRGAVTMTQPGMSSADPADVARYVLATKACGQLANATIELDGPGFGAAPQPVLPVQQRTNIAAIWEAALQACGAQVNSVPTPPIGSPVATSYVTEPVAVMVIPAFAVINKPIVMDNASPLGFAPDSATFREPQQADAVLGDLAQRLREHPDSTVTITGSTANEPTAWPSLQALGTARAQACKTALITLGVAADRITAIGVGYQADPPGDDPAAAALNRKVVFDIKPV